MEQGVDGRATSPIVAGADGAGPFEGVAPLRDAEPAPTARRWRTRNVVAVVLFGLCAAAVGASLFIPLPYYTLGPGQVRKTDPLITTDGTRYDPEGHVAFTTVSVRGPISIWEAAWAGFDNELEVVPDEVINQGRSNQETREANRRLMDESKTVSISVALHELGLSVDAGAQIVEVVDESPAGPLLDPGQVIVSVDGVSIFTSEAVVEAVGTHKPGDEISLVVADPPEVVGSKPDRNLRTVKVTLAEHPERPAAGFLGIQVRTYRSSSFPATLDIDSGAVGGPSAGLAFTLGVMDVLTPGEITGGSLVAVTGTIASDGSVGPIGGLVHKVDAAKHAGATLFLVPSSQSTEELAAAKARAGEDIEIVPVATVDEALAALVSFGGTKPVYEPVSS